MNIRRRTLSLTLIAVILSVSFIYIHRELIMKNIIPKPKMYYSDMGENTSWDNFLVQTKNCFIPSMDPFAPTIRKFIHINKHYKCKTFHFITYQEKYNIKINATVVLKYHQSSFEYCRYIPFIKAGKSDKKMELLWKKSRRFTKSVVATDPFVKVECFDRNRKIIETQFFAFIFRNKTLDEIMETRLKRVNGKQPMNVLLLVFEATSRLNFIRHMEYTYNYLVQEMRAIEMLGYNKIGLNSFPNLASILIGLPPDIIGYKGPYDNHSVIMKNFSQAGYRTYLNEDLTPYGLFNFLKKGFEREPVDHYMRTYMLRKEQNYRNGYCLGNKMVSEVLIEDLLKFIQVYQDVPYFAYSMLTRQSHNDPNGLGPADIPFFNMIRMLHNKQFLENTVVILLGDHGFRFGSFRNTLQGRMEENLPALLLAFPQWFRYKYKHLFQNLKSNARKLTTNYDIHATFHDIISIGRGELSYLHDNKYGVSLLRTIPNDRTCNSSHIPAIYCACLKYTPIDIKTPILKNIIISIHCFQN